MRSYLFVPADVPAALAEAFDQGADVVVVDLAEAVAPRDRRAARAGVARWLRDRPGDARVWVRINPGPLGHDDAREVVGPGLSGFCVSRTESTTQLDALDAVLSIVESEAGLPHRAIAVAPVLESAGAILAAPAIARAVRVERLHLAETDLRAELGIDPSPDERELLCLRSQVVLASAAAGLAPPVGPASPTLDIAAFADSTEALRRLGFHGRACRYPGQVGVVNQVFTPSTDAVAAAQEILDRHGKAARAGVSAVDCHGRTIDGAQLRAARRTLTLRPGAVPASIR
jgi:citrate lyase subunit beta / citryl-CoA lyase